MERRRKQKGDRASQNPVPSITVYSKQSDLSIAPASVRRLVRFVANQKNIVCEMISVYFVGIREIKKIHSDFFDDPTPTDCMTFPIDQKFLGECVICPKIAIEQNPDNPYEEISQYLIHCLLHLIGYDDIDKKKRDVMRKEEHRLLALARKSKCLLAP